MITEDGKRLKLFSDGIKIDKSLLKYKILSKTSKSNSNYDDIGSDPDSVTSDQFFSLINEGKEQVLKEISSLNNFKEFISSKTAEKFNITISKKLYENLNLSRNIFYSNIAL